MPDPGSTLRLLAPAPHILGFYDGRIEGVRYHSAAENWLDDGAFALGICSYAILDGDEALVYDTHISLAHAGIIRRTLEARGAKRIRVVLSHWHTDHVAGNEVFRDCEIIANPLTRAAMAAHREALEGGDPPIRPLILPNRIFEDALTLTVGTVAVTLRQADIHSRDGTVLLLEDGTLLAGDTLEDPVTYVDEADRLADHLVDLERMAGWGVRRILPSHGVEAIIAAGGYGPGFIEATRRYVARLARCRAEPGLADPDLRRFAAEAFATGEIHWFEPYETVHRRNLAAVAGLAPGDPTP